MVEAGLFVLVGIFASIFTFGGFRSANKYPKGILHVVAIALFMIMSVWNLSGEEVSATTTVTTETAELTANTSDPVFMTFTENKTSQTVLIEEGQGSFWIGYVWMGLAGLNLILFVKDVWNAS